ncbi:TorF family putative porin [Parvibium lacunae]|uniref:Porin n=1 Tax=Parvibium lacunae TaxID=1888893 RepID=A0A368L1V9_9BURK|nr:TorF family putative porin [Parvibium lacunae]RCS57102.1 hypothetical protein DU000_09875 [Parvibium lacunae]
MNTRLQKTLLSAALLAAASGAYAADAPASDHTFTGNFGLYSDYRFRGISQTYLQPALQGGLDYSHSSGVYIGLWSSNVSSNLYQNGNGQEVDLYLGFKKELVKDFTVDGGFLQYYYPAAKYGNGATVQPQGAGQKYDNRELYVAMTYKWLALKYSHAITDYFGVNQNTYGGYCGLNGDGSAPTTGCIATNRGGSKGSGYIDLTGTFPITDKFSLVAHYGHTKVKNYGELSYSDWKLGATYDLGGWILGASYIDTNAKERFYRYGQAAATPTGANTAGVKDPSKSTVVLSISKTF